MFERIPGCSDTGHEALTLAPRESRSARLKGRRTHFMLHRTEFAAPSCDANNKVIFLLGYRKAE